MDTRPVDLAAPAQPQPSRWCVTYPADDAGHWHEAYYRDRALAEATAAAHRGSVIVPLVALGAWPVR